MKEIAIIGAGISGLTCARELDPEQYDVTIFDKSRGKGGRVSTRRNHEFQFDHGAQYISEPETKEFRIEHSKWLEDGIIDEWQGQLGQLTGSRYSNSFKDKKIYVGVPKMSIIGNYLAEQLKNVVINQPVKITSIFKKFNEWYLEDEEGVIHGGYELIIIAIPPPQAITLVKDFDYLVNILDEIKLSPRWACMVGFNHKIAVDYDGVFIEKIKDNPIFNSPIRWIARNNSKPGRPDKEAWVIHATKEWSRKYLDKSEEWVENKLIEEFRAITGFDNLPIKFQQAHRWRYGLVDKSLDQHFILDNNRNIGLIGDFCMGNNIEAAYISGKMVARRINNLRV